MEGVVQMYRFLCAEGACVCVCPLKGGLSRNGGPSPPPSKRKMIELVSKRGVNDDRKKGKTRKGLAIR